MKDAHTAIGRYIVEFEQVMFAIKNHIDHLFLIGGLKDVNLARAFTQNKFVSANTLVQTLSAMLRELGHLSDGKDPVKGKVYLYILKQCDVAIQRRNEYAHGTWLGVSNVGQAEGDVKIDGFKYDVSKSKGVDPKDIGMSAKELHDASDQLSVLFRLINKAYSLLLIPEGLPMPVTFDQHFTLVGSDWLPEQPRGSTQVES